MKKITTTGVHVRGLQKWRVRWTDEQGWTRRKFFGGKKAAEACAAGLRGQVLTVENRLSVIPKDDRERMLFVWEEAKRRGIDPMALLASPEAPAGSPTLMKVLDEMETAKRKAGRVTDYLTSLSQIVKMFAPGRERMPINRVTVQQGEAFLDSKNLRSRSTLRARLSTQFKFEVRRGYRSDNP